VGRTLSRHPPEAGIDRRGSTAGKSLVANPSPRELPSDSIAAARSAGSPWVLDGAIVVTLRRRSRRE
jgi:hypothetical protein